MAIIGENVMLQRFFIVFKKGLNLSKSLIFLQILSVLISLVSFALNLLMPKYLLQMVGKKSVTGCLLILTIALAVTLLCNFISSIIGPHIDTKKQKISLSILDEFLEKSVSFRLQYFDQPKAYDRYTLVFEKCTSIFDKANSVIIDIILSFFQILIVIGILSWMNHRVLFILLVVAVIQAVITNSMRKDMYIYTKKMANNNRKLNYIYRLFHIPDFFRDIRVNSIKDFIFEKKKTTSQIVIEDTYRIKKKNALKMLFHGGLTAIETFGVLLYFAYQVIIDKIWYDNLTASINAFSQLKSTLLKFFTIYNDIYENDLYIADYLDFMNNIETENSDKKKIIVDDIQTIEFRNVSFRYPNTASPALNRISFRINKGDKIAIVGTNGSGKTTLIKLLLGLYPPSDGEILINNISLDKYDLESLRKKFSVLFQDYSLYAFTVRENLTLGTPFSEERIKCVLEQVKMWDKIQSLPLGLDTPLTNQLLENGVEFSGGERQRLAIARVYLRNKSFVVLDEPTSNLDSIVENNLYEELIQDKNNTLIIISHKMPFASRMSKIICLSNGRVEAEGTHDELLSHSGVYKKLYGEYIAKYTI